MVNAKNIKLKILYHLKADEERVTNCRGEGVLSSMKDSIACVGLRNPLTVMLPTPNSKGNWYRVIDGSLRLMALKELAREGCEVVGRKLTMDSFIRCVEVPRMDKAELEKFQRAKSHLNIHWTAEDRQHRIGNPKPVDIHVGNLYDAYKLSNKRRLLSQMDFASVEVSLALHGYGTMPVLYKSHSFDLGDDW